MQRRQFIGSVSGPVLAACAVCLGACSKSDAGGNATNPVVPPSNVNLSIDLNSNLLSVGSSMVQNGVIIARLATGNTSSSFTAVQVACTHEGSSINYNAAGNNFVCPLHGSVFTSTGAVSVGPAVNSLKKYTVVVTGNSLTITG